MIHILVLEDDPKQNQLVCAYLSDSGFEVKGCLSASDAYDEMYNRLYDLIISDIMMPGSIPARSSSCPTMTSPPIWG